VDSLDVVRMIVSPGSSHAAGMDVVGCVVAIIGEWFVAEGAYAILGDNLPVEKFPHFAVRAEFPVSPGMMRVFDAPNAHLALALFSWDYLSAAAGERTVKWAQLISTESHGFLQFGFGGINADLG
jgi:hypothetical protein